MNLWTHHGCFGGIALQHRDGDPTMALIIVEGRCAYSTALKRARRMVRLLNAGEVALAPRAAGSETSQDSRKDGSAPLPDPPIRGEGEEGSSSIESGSSPVGATEARCQSDDRAEHLNDLLTLVAPAIEGLAVVNEEAFGAGTSEAQRWRFLHNSIVRALGNSEGGAS